MSFGNARGVRNIFERVLVAQAGRLAAQPEVSREDLTRLTAADINELGGKEETDEKA